VTAAADVEAFLALQMADAETQWSIGTFGAIAEFARDAREPGALSSLSAATARGAIRIDPHSDLRPFAFETATKDGWNQRVALCLPQHGSAMSERTVLTELGPDTDAMRREDRGGILFDLGLGALQVDCCVRVADAEVAALLRSHCGQPAFGSPAMGIILATNPHRVFLSRLGRIEVFQPIPPPNGTSPEGPHTHVLPGLLRHRRTHAATEPIPQGYVPCAYVYPGHAAKDRMGRSRPFDRARHEAFQAILRRYGDPASVALKQTVTEAVAAGIDPSAIPVTERRFVRTNIRVTLRQLRAAQEHLASLPVWMAAHERSGHDDGTDDPHHHEAHAS